MLSVGEKIGDDGDRDADDGTDKGNKDDSDIDEPGDHGNSKDDSDDESDDHDEEDDAEISEDGKCGDAGDMDKLSVNLLYPLIFSTVPFWTGLLMMQWHLLQQQPRPDSLQVPLLQPLTILLQ